MIIKLNVTHNLLKTTFIEIRFDTNDKILDVKDKIYKMTGTTPASQDLTLIRGPNNQVKLSPENATLADFGAENGMDLHCIDRNPMTVLNFLNEDVEKVYVRMSDTDYDKLEGTVRAFKRDKFKNDPEYRQHVLEARKKRL